METDIEIQVSHKKNEDLLKLIETKVNLNDFDVSHHESSEGFMISATLGSEGFETLITIVESLGPKAKAISATYQHDEEPPEDSEWPQKITYRDGIIYVNGEQYPKELTIDLTGKCVSFAVMQDEELIEEWIEELEIFDVEVQMQIDSKTDYVVYADPEDDEDTAECNDNDLLQKARKEGHNLISFFKLQDLVEELHNKYA